MVKRFLYLGLALFIVSGLFFYYYFVLQNTTRTEARNIIPQDAIFILEAEQPITNWEAFHSSSLWTFLKTHPYLSELNADAHYLDSLIKENEFLLKHFGNRSFHMSAHMTHEKDYDFLFVIDLKNAANFQPHTFILQSMLNSDFFEVSKQSFESADIYDIYDRQEGDHLYLAKHTNFIVCSYTKNLVLKSIKTNGQNSLTSDDSYMEVTNETSLNGLARLYIQYAYIDDYLNIYTQNNESILHSLSTSFAHSGFDIYLKKESAVMKGYTSLPKGATNYTHLVQKFGNAPLHFQDVLSSRTAYAQVIALNNFNTFYDSIVQLKQRDEASIQNYNQVKNKVEKVLHLSIKEDLLSWIGNEVVLARNQPSSLAATNDDYIVAVRMNNKENTSNKLLKIQKQIKKRTPAKFRKMSYKAHDIYYLDIKGFFGLFFGKSFEKITKPYYTMLDNYVLFSNNPTSLIASIEDYENGNILANLSSFQNLQKDIPEEVAFFTYINGNLAYDALSHTIDKSELTQYQLNKKYFHFFKSIGISYTSKDQGFKNTIALHYGENQQIPLPPPPLIDSLESSYFEDHSTQLQNLSEAETFVLNNIKDGQFIKYFKGSDQIQIKAKTKKGTLHGKFTEYYKNGKIRSQGKYRKGKKSGRWKYYNHEGILTEKEWEGF